MDKKQTAIQKHRAKQKESEPDLIRFEVKIAKWHKEKLKRYVKNHCQP